MDTVSNKHDLAHYVEEINLGLQQDYQQIRSRVSEDPGTAGDQAEETWAAVLRRWLPAHYHVRTKGRVISSTGKASSQIDILILWPSYPPFLLDKKLYLASGVAAAFECKLTLRKSHLRKIFETAVQLSEITEKEHSNRKSPIRKARQNYAYHEFHRLFEYGLLAHSYEGVDSEKDAKTISEEVKNLDEELVTHPKQMLDLICVQYLGSWASERCAISEAVEVKEGRALSTFFQHPYTNYHCLTRTSWAEGSELNASFSPLGSFLARLYRKLARVDNSLLPLANFYTTALATGQGGGGGGRVWTEITTPEDIWKLSEPSRLSGSPLHEGFAFFGF